MPTQPIREELELIEIGQKLYKFLSEGKMTQADFFDILYRFTIDIMLDPKIGAAGGAINLNAIGFELECKELTDLVYSEVKKDKRIKAINKPIK